MKEYTLTEEEIKGLKSCLDPDMGHSAFWMRNEIKTNILPELFEDGFEVGKYYSLRYKACDFVFKVTEIREDGMVEGYGLDLKPVFKEDALFEHTGWTDIEYFEHAKEITREEFLEYIKTYAIEELGFKEGVEFKSASSGEIFTGHGKIVNNTNVEEYPENIHFEGSGAIFHEGKFAEIIERTEKIKQTPTSTWFATNQLRFKQTRSGKSLQQKSVNVETEEERWDTVQTEYVDE